MAAEIRVDTIKSRAGINTISLNNNTLFVESYVGIGTTNAGEALQVDGNIRVGASTQSNYIAFKGTNFDGNPASGIWNTYTHTYVGERIYDYTASNSERSELLLFKGNDVKGNFGADRIRLVAGEHRFDVLGVSTAGTFEQVGVSTAAVNVVAITTTGVGVGTTSPTQKIEINSDTLGGLRINTNSEYPALWLAQNGDNKWSITSNLNGDSGFVIRESGIADRVNIKPGGSVGIGTTNPVSPLGGSAALHIFGGNGLNVQSIAPSIFLTETDNSNNYYNLVVDGGAFGVRYNNNFPAPLQVNSSSVLVGSATSTGTASQPLQVTGGAYVSGNLGIGNTNPSYKLDVTGVVRLGNSVSQGAPSSSNLFTNAHTLLSGQGGNYLAVGQYGVSSNYAQWVQSSFVTPSTTTYNIVLQPLGGNVGVGSTIPNAKVAVAGSITELSQGQYWNVVTQADVGIGASQVPLNQYLGQMAFVDNHYPSLTASSGTADANIILDCSATERYYHVASFTADRTLYFNNFTPGKEVVVYLRNTNGSARTITVQASTTTISHANVSLAPGAGTIGAASVSTVTLAATSGTTVIWVSNIDGNFAGGLIA